MQKKKKNIASIALMVEVLLMPFYLISDPSIHLTICPSSSITFFIFFFNHNFDRFHQSAKRRH